MRQIKLHRVHKVFFLVILLASCVTPYEPAVITNNINLLVVDGFIDVTNDAAVVKLSRTMPLVSEEESVKETGAEVFIESTDGTRYTLEEGDAGSYLLGSVEFDVSGIYRLVINTEDGKRYDSEEITLSETPAIDDVTWSPQEDGVLISLDTHGPSDQTGYYRWTYTETWEYTAPYQSLFDVVNGEMVARPETENIYFCWSSRNSTEILVSSSAHLGRNLIKDFPIVLVPPQAIKLSRRYSILVRQYSITRKEFEFWQKLEQTTENLGGLYDPMPYKLTGNIRSTSHPDEPVLGYFGGATVQEKRMFLSGSQLPRDLQSFPLYHCPVDTLMISNLPPNFNIEKPIGIYGKPAPIGYIVSTIECVDCTKRGGTNIKPQFWEE